MEILLRQHGAKLHGVAFQFMRNEAETQDVMQEALLSIWNKIDSFEGRSAFTSWMYRVAANAALMRLRKDKRRAQDISTDDDTDNAPPALSLAKDVQPLPDAQIQAVELKDRIQAAIDQLAEPYRTTFILKDVEDFSLQEIADATQTSLPAVKSRLHRARLALRQILLPYLSRAKDKKP
jgi:RNA polymerase sigma-70 factor (ECF subfamily)